MMELRRLTEQIAPRSAGLCLYARQWLDAAAAEDVVQQALVSLLSMSTVPTDPVAWMYRVVRNAALDEAKARRRRRTRERESAQVEWFMPTTDGVLDAATAQRALQHLPAEFREVILLRIWGELGFASIASVLGCSVSTAHSRYAAALSALRIRLEKSCPNVKT
jgi:RNA polymerase sigma-70 factor (ECF subfamily)